MTESHCHHAVAAATPVHSTCAASAAAPVQYLVVAPLAIPVGGILAFLFEAKKIACSFFTVLT
ncbi:hypothetical protein, partial [Bosea sp. (in: a-proteobacteria)]|uniref:hypothetical protein n=1 Tax=Bosea sp. (in: a-proteobacteria) TaxID=1871050 RepID=UPI004033DA9D